MRATDIKVASGGELWIGSRKDKNGGDSCRYESKADISLYGLENGYIPKDEEGSKMENSEFGWRFLWAHQGSGKFSHKRVVSETIIFKPISRTLTAYHFNIGKITTIFSKN